MALVIQAAAVGIVAGLFALLLRRDQPTFAYFIGLFAGIFLLFRGLTVLLPVLQSVQGIFQQTGNTESYTLLLKAVGICLIAGFAAEHCKEAGQTALAGEIDLIGRAAILLLSLPLLQRFVGFLNTLVG